MKLNSKGKFEEECLFLKLLSQSLEGFTPRGDVINPKIGQKVQIDISCTNVDRKMKIKSKMLIEVNYSLMKLFSQNLEFLTQSGSVINQKLPQ